MSDICMNLAQFAAPTQKLIKPYNKDQDKKICWSELTQEEQLKVEQIITQPSFDPMMIAGGKEIKKSQLDCLQKLAKDNGIELGDILSGIKVHNGKIYDLDLSKTKITDVSALSGLRELVYLDLSFTGINDINELSALKDLRYINLRGSKVSDISTLSNMKELQGVNLMFTPVNDISALKYLGELTAVDLSHTQISDISALKSLKNLKMLGLSYTKVSDVSPLKDLENLEMLYLSYTKVKNVAYLGNLQKLERLYLENVPLISINSLSGLKSLKVLSLRNTKVSDLSAVASMSNLMVLDLSSTQVSDLAPLYKLKKLVSLNLENTNVSSVYALREMKLLQSLYLYGTQVNNIDHLSGLSGLKLLDLRKTLVKDISAIKGMPQLELLTIGGTQISDLTPLKGLKSLRLLDLANTPVEDLSALSGLYEMRELYLTDNKVSDISALTGLIKMKLLDLDGTQVSDISSLQGMSDLEELRLGLTPVSDLGALEGKSKIKELYLHNTQVSDLTALSGMSELQLLSLNATPIKSIKPLEGLTKLQMLNIRDTKVKDISPLKGSIDLNYLNLSGTKVASIKILSELVNLEVLNLSGTKVKNFSVLQSLTNLKELNLSKTKISAKQIKKLKEVLPGWSLGATQKLIDIKADEIIFRKGYLPAEGAKININGQQNAKVYWGPKEVTIGSIKKPEEVTFVFDCSGSMEKKFPKFKSAFKNLLKELPNDINYKLNTFGPENALFGDWEHEASMEVKGGTKEDLIEKIDGVDPNGASLLWGNLAASVKGSKAGGVVILYSDGKSDTAPVGKGQEEKNKDQKIQDIIEYSQKNDVQIFIACGNMKAQDYMYKALAGKNNKLPGNIHIYKTYDLNLRTPVVDAILKPQNPYYKVEVNDMGGDEIETLTVGNPPKKSSKKTPEFKAQAQNMQFLGDGQLSIGGKVEVEFYGEIDLDDYEPAGLAEFVFEDVSLVVDPVAFTPKKPFVSLVLDRSGSMGGENIEQLKVASQEFCVDLTDYPDFNLIEFNDKTQLDKLCKAISYDNYGPSFVEPANTADLPPMYQVYMRISRLNDLLRTPGFFDIWLVKSDKLSLPQVIHELEGATKDIRSKNFDELTDAEQKMIMRLNRLVLELTYPELCPESHLSDKGAMISLNFFPDDNDTEKVEIEHTDNIELISKVIKSVGSDGGTPGWRNMLISLMATPENGNLVVFSDGIFNGDAKAAKVVFELAKKKNVRIYFIGFGSSFQNVAKDENPGNCAGFMKYITAPENTNGAYVSVQDAKELASAFRKIREDIQQEEQAVAFPAQPTAVKIPVKNEQGELILKFDLPSAQSKK